MQNNQTEDASFQQNPFETPQSQKSPTVEINFSSDKQNEKTRKQFEKFSDIDENVEYLSE